MAEKILDVSVVMCVYTEERWDDIVAAVESLQQQNALPREIIVAVDHNPALLERVRAHLPSVVAIENNEPRGLSGGRNSAIAIAQGKCIAFLDDDATAEPDWLQRLYRCCQDPQVLGAGGTVEPRWTSKRPAWFPEEFYWTVGCTYQRRPEKPVVVRNPFGGCTCFRREVFEVVGGFRNGIGRAGKRPMGCEETELCIRAKQYWPQKYFLYEPKARIQHRVPAARGQWSYFRSRCYAEGLSKATIAQFVGAKDSLASERAYTLQTLPLGVMRGIKDGLLHFDLSGFQRAGAICAGLVITTAGYLIGSISQRLALPAEEGSGTLSTFKQLSHPKS